MKIVISQFQFVKSEKCFQKITIKLRELVHPQLYFCKYLWWNLRKIFCMYGMFSPLHKIASNKILGMATANLAHTVNTYVNLTLAIDSLLKVLSKHPLWQILCFVFNLLLSILGVHDVCCSFCDMPERPISCKNSSRYPSHYWYCDCLKMSMSQSTNIYYQLSWSILGHFEGLLLFIQYYQGVMNVHVLWGWFL